MNIVKLFGIKCNISSLNYIICNFINMMRKKHRESRCSTLRTQKEAKNIINAGNSLHFSIGAFKTWFKTKILNFFLKFVNLYIEML